MQDQYADFARDYDWLISDFQRIGDRHVRDAATWLGAPEGARVLDCACGTGLVALALARQGYPVVGSDASAAMVEQAGQRAKREGLSLPLAVCAWEDLPRQFGPEFDFVLCGGNSIGHCRDEVEMVRSLAAMRGVLKPGGSLTVETRDWEKLHAARVRFTCFGPRERDGERCVPLYVWNFTEDVTAPVVVEVVLPIEADGGMTLRVYPITYYPFTIYELTSRMRKAGFADPQPESREDGTVRVVGSAA